jgi:hypothetical protein
MFHALNSDLTRIEVKPLPDGNIHTGAKPPWMRDDLTNDTELTNTISRNVSLPLCMMNSIFHFSLPLFLLTLLLLLLLIEYEMKL